MNVLGVVNSTSDRSDQAGRHRAARRWIPVAAAGTLALATLFTGAPAAQAAIVPTVLLATADQYSVLAGSTVSNTGPSILDQNAGVDPGSAIVGFPPGILLPPSVFHAADAQALQAQSDLTLAYVDAANRPINATTTADLGGLTLVGGVYGGPANGALSLTGPLVLDGAGDPNSVFIFQTGSSLITASASTVSLINGAQECNVFWQVGSSVTLGTGSVFRGNILALTSISVNTGVTIGGRALARNGAVTLDNDVFTTPTCDLVTPTPTTTAAPPTDVTTVPGGGADTTAVGGGTLPGTGDTLPGGGSIPPVTAPGTQGPGTAPTDLTLPRTGHATKGAASLAGVLLLAGLAVAFLARRPQARGR
jgi:LPXTG-motif cell wall-anchored protein